MRYFTINSPSGPRSTDGTIRRAQPVGPYGEHVRDRAAFIESKITQGYPCGMARDMAIDRAFRQYEAGVRS